MPLTIKSAVINYKDPDTGDYVEVNAVGDTAHVTDVLVDNVSSVENNVARVDAATSSKAGVVIVNPTYGHYMTNRHIVLQPPTDTQIKSGSWPYVAVTPSSQHKSVFYGLAKLAGVDMKDSSNPVGEFTDEAKVAIQKMLGLYEAPWELIKEDTFTNATEADHIITTDADGHPLELTDAILLFETPVQETYSAKGQTGHLWFYYDSSNYISSECGAWTQNASTSAHTCGAELTQTNGIIRMVIIQSATNGTLAIRYSRVYPGLKSSSKAQGYRSNNNTPLIFNQINIKAVTGTGHYVLYGKRKWT